ncbi:MAG: hypothetical protein JJV97_04460 [SAR324 cluster bacterium]|nr:hypothetical protein [SAR324 cluster bacterium]
MILPEVNYFKAIQPIIYFKLIIIVASIFLSNSCSQASYSDEVGFTKIATKKPVNNINPSEWVVISKKDYKAIQNNVHRLEKSLSSLNKDHLKVTDKHQKELSQNDKKIADLKILVGALRSKININIIQNTPNNTNDSLFSTKPKEVDSASLGRMDSKKGLLLPSSSQKNVDEPIVDSSGANSSDSQNAKKRFVIDYNDPDLINPAVPLILVNAEGAQIEYTKAYGTYLKNDYPSAIRMFSNFLERFSTDQYSHNAEYWLGMSYFNLNKLDFAEKHFRNVLRKFTHLDSLKGYKTPNTIYMLGNIYERLDDIPKSRYYYWKVVELFPKTASASNARAKLTSNN